MEAGSGRPNRTLVVAGFGLAAEAMAITGRLVYMVPIITLSLEPSTYKR